MENAQAGTKADVVFEVGTVWYKSVAMSIGIGAAVALAVYKSHEKMVKSTFDNTHVEVPAPDPKLN